MDHGCRSGLDASVVAVDRLVSADGRVLEVPGVLLGDEDVDVVAQAPLVAFEGENIVRLLVDDGPGDWRWHPIASMVTMAPAMAIISKSLGIATISFDFSATFTCPSTNRWRAAKAETI